MAETEISTDLEEVTTQWMQVTNAVARGRLAPEDGVAKLWMLAEANPADRDWLEGEIETIRWQFAVDAVDNVHESRGSYWDKMRLVIGALLDERLDHDRALELLGRIDAHHPEHAEHTARLRDGIADSPLRRFLDTDDR